MVVLGDSVTWGQGLPAPRKMHQLVAGHFSPSPAIDAVLAHSGAVIGICGRRTRPPVHGEVPTAYPSVLQQCDAFVDDPAGIDLVIVNGGINDVDIRFILNPFTETDDLRDAIERCCFCDMRDLLRHVAAKFSNPAARIVVTTYYPILSEQSRFGLANEFLLTLGVPIAPVATIFGSGGPVWEKIIDHASIFYRESSDAIARAIAAVNDPRCRMAGPTFTAANAALAPDAWLFGIRWDFSPQDPVAAERRAMCRRDEPDPIRREQCYRASAGHPNVAGARKFADSIIGALA
jgi:lysophospholipase L1-like esterase